MEPTSLFAALLVAARHTGGDAVLDDLGALEAAVEAGIRAALVSCLPEVIRRAQLPPYLTRRDLSELTGWSLRKVDYLKAKRRITYVRRGRTVLFPTSEVEAYFDEGRVEARHTT